MAYTEEQQKEHVYALQNALYNMGMQDKTLPRVVPDGIYGPETTDCVTEMQRRYGLPETGRVDQETWDLIFSKYVSSMEKNGAPHVIRPFAPGPLHIERGQVDSGIGMLQAMLWNLNKKYNNIQAVPITMRYDDMTIEQVRKVQRLSGLPENDVLDNQTWNKLVILCNALCDIT